MVYCGSFNVWPVRMRTARSLPLSLPKRTSFLTPAKVTALAGSQPTPSGADLGFGQCDLLLGDLFAPAAHGLDDSCGFAPAGGVADADGGGAGVGYYGLHDAVGVHVPAVEGVGAFGLDDVDLGDLADHAEVLELLEAFAQGGAVARLPPGTMTWSGTSQLSCSSISKAGVFWPSRR